MADTAFSFNAGGAIVYSCDTLSEHVHKTNESLSEIERKYNCKFPIAVNLDASEKDLNITLYIGCKKKVGVVRGYTFRHCTNTG